MLCTWFLGNISALALSEVQATREGGDGGWLPGWVDLYLWSSPGWWAATVATYCPSRMMEHPKSKSTQPSNQPPSPPCTCFIVNLTTMGKKIRAKIRATELPPTRFPCEILATCSTTTTRSSCTPLTTPRSWPRRRPARPSTRCTRSMWRGSR